MKPLFAGSQSDSDVASNFWPLATQATSNVGTFRTPTRAATNLYELFVHDLSVVVAGACQTDRLARSVFATIAPDQVGMRKLVLGLAKSARGCLPSLPPVLVDEGLVLPLTHDFVIDVLLRPITPDRQGPSTREPMSVAGARAIRAFTHVALRFETALSRAAEDAWLLGSDRLRQALTGWATMWRDYLRDLRLREKSYRAQAYAAGLLTPPCWQTA